MLFPQNAFELLRTALGLDRTNFATDQQTALADWASSIEWSVKPSGKHHALTDATDAPPIAIVCRKRDAERIAAILRDYGAHCA